MRVGHARGEGAVLEFAPAHERGAGEAGGKERILDLYAVNEADIRGKAPTIDPDSLKPLEALKLHVDKVLADGAALSTRDLAIDGHVLMKELGLKPGRIIGEILELLLEEVIADPSKNDRAVLLDLARASVAARRT